MTEQELIEQLADKEHASWARWMDYLFNQCDLERGKDHFRYIIPHELVQRWKRQVEAPYAALSEREKQSDRDEVAHILPIIDEYMKQAATAISNAQMKQGVRLHPNAMLQAIEDVK